MTGSESVRNEGRFISEDTYHGETDVPDTWHLYAYCANGPINHVDPTGHIIWDNQKTYKQHGKRRMTRTYCYNKYYYIANIKIRNRFTVKQSGVTERVKKSTCWVSKTHGDGRASIGKPHSSDTKAMGQFSTCNVYFDVTITPYVPGTIIEVTTEKIRCFLHIRLIKKKKYGWYVKAGVEQERV